MQNFFTANPWLQITRAAPRARLRLFCFPYSGGNAALFHAWQAELPAEIAVCPVQLPGRGARLAEPPFTQLAPLVRAVASALYDYFDQPFAFFGHSMGALLSFELARYLREHFQISPAHLIVSGHGAPQLPDRNPPIHALPHAEFIAKLREFNGTPSQVLDNPELLEIILPVLRADFAICETYRYEPRAPLACPISAFGGVADAYVSRAELVAWRAQTNATFSARLLPGDHFFINTTRAALLHALAQELEPVLRNHAVNPANGIADVVQAAGCVAP
ncbi:MAG: thioesterase [Chloroflexi bacterium]|nr:thioesterase [Chloroflexota bacterium]